MKIEQTGEKYPRKFEIGDKAICKAYQRFTDGSEHREGEIILVKPSTVSYFNVNQQFYEKV